MRRLAVALAATLLVSGCSDDATAPSAGPSPSPTAQLTSYVADGNRIWGGCVPGESPTVVYLHGLGGRASDLSGLVASVRSTNPDTAQCAYDRVNAGSSERVSENQPLADSVAELEDFLAAAKVRGPLVLVGHSYGGLLAFAYAGAHPDNVHGIVLADAVLPFELPLFTPEVIARVRALSAGNTEYVDLLDSYATAAEAEVPDVPVVYVDATQEDFPADWGIVGYREALAAYISSLPQGELVLSDSSHTSVAVSPELAAAVAGVLP